MLDSVKEVIKFTIDGQEIEANQGETIIQAADRYGIYIPRFCYHEKLSVVANCRMCLVEVVNVPKALPACATAISKDMQVFTRSAVTVDAQKAVMEFLLINHPLDCPICDQGGECELQDLAMGFGKETSRYDEEKRSVLDENLGPLIATDMTRCIHCTRCVRFGTEIAGVSDLGVMGRGEDMYIGTYLEKGLSSELSGNYIDVCPVGALTSKPYRYRGRSWGFSQHVSYAVHDCLGSSIYIQTVGKGYNNKTQIMRVLPKANENINQVWLSDRDRFSYEGLFHKDRLAEPMVKVEGVWEKLSWDDALQLVVEKTQKIFKEYGPEQLGVLLSPSVTIEEGYLLQKLARSLGCGNIDHRLSQVDNDFNICIDDKYFSTNLLDLAKQKTIVLVGSYIRHEQPLAAVRVRESQLSGGKVYSINPIEYNWNFAIEESVCVAGSQMIEFLAECLLEVARIKSYVLDSNLLKSLVDIKIGVNARSFVAKWLKEESLVIVLGSYALSHPDAGILYILAKELADLCQGSLMLMTQGANSRGLHRVGAVSHYGLDEHKDLVGESAVEMLAETKKMYWLYQLEPEYDVNDSRKAFSSINQAQQVICFNSYVTEKMLDYADIILPITPCSEMAGTMINAFADVNKFSAAKEHFEMSKPGWKVCRVLGNLFGLDTFLYRNIAELQKEIDKIDTVKGKSLPAKVISWQKKNLPSNILLRIGDVPMYRVDSIVRRAGSLQKVYTDMEVARLSEQTAQHYALDESKGLRVVSGGAEHFFDFKIDNSICFACVYIPGALPETSFIGPRHAYLELLEEDS